MTCDGTRKIIQYGNYQIKSVSSASFQHSNRFSMQTAGFNNGSIFSGITYTNSTDISLVIEEDFCRYTGDELKLYLSWMKRELNAPNKLFAIDYDGSLIYTDAVLKSINYDYTYQAGVTVLNIVFTNISGTWTKADGKTTFIVNSCDRDYIYCKQCLTRCGEIEVYKDCGHCECAKCGCCFDCYIPLCNIENTAEFFGCNDNYKVTISCTSGENMFGIEAVYGTEIPINFEQGCTTNIICTEGEMETSNGTITLTGTWLNPEITINGRVLGLRGLYDGELVIDSRNNTITLDKAPITSIGGEIVCYRLPYFKLSNGRNNNVQMCGYTNNSKAFYKFDALTY